MDSPAAPAVTEPATGQPQGQEAKRLVIKNTVVLLAGQLLGAPLNILVAVVMGRYLGASFYGAVYLITARIGLLWLAVDWGQGQVMTGEIARNRARAGELLGTSLVWRLVASVLVYGILALWYSLEPSAPENAQTFLLLLAIQSFLMSLNNASLDAIKGLERADVSAVQNVIQPLLSLAFMVPVVAWFHLGVRAALIAQNAVYLVTFVYVWRARGQVGIKPIRFSLKTLTGYFGPGTAFLIFGVVMVAQPAVDAWFLQHARVPLDVVGWNGAARRLIGPLILPASVLIGALYPTLSRLHVESKDDFASTLRSSIKGILILAFPIGLGCALFADLGVLLFGPKFEGSQANMIVLAPYVFAMYFSMPLGIAILAAQQRWTWAAVQSLCVVISLILDPLLIPWFQARYGNGGLGVCVSAVVSEVFMVAGGAYLVPKGTFDRGFFVSLFKCLLAGAAMSAVAIGAKRLPVHLLIIAPVSVAAYFGALWAVGGLKGEQMDRLFGGIKRKLSRR